MPCGNVTQCSCSAVVDGAGPGLGVPVRGDVVLENVVITKRVSVLMVLQQGQGWQRYKAGWSGGKRKDKTTERLKDTIIAKPPSQARKDASGSRCQSITAPDAEDCACFGLVLHTTTARN